MDVAARFLADHVSMLLLGTTAMLFVAALASALCRSPLHRQRAGELGVAATLAWLSLACLPMPRMTWSTAVAPASPPPAVTRADVRLETPPEIASRLAPIAPAAGPDTATETPRVERLPFSDFREPALPAASAPRVDWPLLLARAYLAGVGLCGGWLLLGHVFLFRLVRGATYSAELSGRAGARVLVSDRLSRPFTCGVFRPVIFLPAALLRPEARFQLRQVILHEAAHVRRRDGVGNFVFCVALPLLYVHPLYWLLRRQAGLARELIADDQAARADGKAAYAEQLIALARAGATQMPTPVAAIGIFQNRSHFYRRMHMLLERKTSLPVRCSVLGRAAMAVAVVASVGGGTALLGVRSARAADLAGANAVQTVSEVPVLSKIPFVGHLFVTRTNVQANPLAGVDDKPAVDRPKSGSGSGDGADAARAKAADAGPSVDRLTVNQIAITDPMMRDLLAKRDAIQDEMEKLRLDGPNTDRVKLANEQLSRIEERIELYARDWREFQKFSAASAATAARAGRAAAEGSGLGAGGTGTAGQLDLVNLANTLVDAGSAVKLAKARYQALLPLNNRGALGDADMATAKAQVEASAKRLELFRSMAAAALEDAEADLAIAKRRWESGIIEQKTVSDATLRVKMLRLIVKSAD